MSVGECREDVEVVVEVLVAREMKKNLKEIFESIKEMQRELVREVYKEMINETVDEMRTTTIQMFELVKANKLKMDDLNERVNKIGDSTMNKEQMMQDVRQMVNRQLRINEPIMTKNS